MAEMDPDFCRRFDELDARRARQLKRRERALRALGPSSGGDPSAIEAWREYCESIDRLEQCLADLERLIWDAKPG